MEIIKASWSIGKPIRLITITGISIVPEDESKQLSLFSNPEKDTKRESVERTIDAIREKFGSSSISFGQVLNNDIGINI